MASGIKPIGFKPLVVNGELKLKGLHVVDSLVGLKRWIVVPENVGSNPTHPPI